MSKSLEEKLSEKQVSLRNQLESSICLEGKTIPKLLTNPSLYESSHSLLIKALSSLTSQDQISSPLTNDKNIIKTPTPNLFSRAPDELGLTEICLNLLEAEVLRRVKNLFKYFDVENQDIGSLILSIRLHALRENYSKVEEDLLTVKRHIEELFSFYSDSRIIISELILELILKAQPNIKIAGSSIENNFNLLESLAESLINSYDPAVHQLLLTTAEKIIEVNKVRVFKIDNNKFSIIFPNKPMFFKGEAHCVNLELAKRIKYLAEKINPEPDLSRYQLL